MHVRKELLGARAKGAPSCTWERTLARYALVFRPLAHHCPFGRLLLTQPGGDRSGLGELSLRKVARVLACQAGAEGGLVVAVERLGDSAETVQISNHGSHVFALDEVDAAEEVVLWHADLATCFQVLAHVLCVVRVAPRVAGVGWGWEWHLRNATRLDAVRQLAEKHARFEPEVHCMFAAVIERG